MAKIYIDFDSTLYDTDKMRKYNKDIAVMLSEQTQLSLEHAEREVEETMQSKSKRKVFDVCEDLEKKYAIEKDCLKKCVENLLANGEQFVFDDSLRFLTQMSQNGSEINILTYTGKAFDYQMQKLIGSGILKFVDNVIVCSKHKGALDLDYANGIFVDDNPMELESLSQAGVAKERLFRMRRRGAGYSEVEINEDICTDISSFDEIKFL